MEPLDEDEILALHEYIVYNRSVRYPVDTADRAIRKLRIAAQKIHAERRGRGAR